MRNFEGGLNFSGMRSIQLVVITVSYLAFPELHLIQVIV
jgi:hypothetical protein